MELGPTLLRELTIYVPPKSYQSLLWELQFRSVLLCKLGHVSTWENQKLILRFGKKACLRSNSFSSIPHPCITASLSRKATTPPSLQSPDCSARTITWRTCVRGWD